MDEAEYQAVSERLSKLDYAGVVSLEGDGAVLLEGELTAHHLEQILKALRGQQIKGASDAV